MENRLEAIEDAKYFIKLSDSALDNQIDLWCNNSDEMSEDDQEYFLTLLEIKGKLGSINCLLKEN